LGKTGQLKTSLGITLLLRGRLKKIKTTFLFFLSQIFFLLLKKPNALNTFLRLQGALNMCFEDDLERPGFLERIQPQGILVFREHLMAQGDGIINCSTKGPGSTPLAG